MKDYPNQNLEKEIQKFLEKEIKERNKELIYSSELLLNDYEKIDFDFYFKEIKAADCSYIYPYFLFLDIHLDLDEDEVLTTDRFSEIGPWSVPVFIFKKEGNSLKPIKTTLFFEVSGEQIEDRIEENQILSELKRLVQRRKKRKI